jgi:hypothetical protein
LAAGSSLSAGTSHEKRPDVPLLVDRTIVGWSGKLRSIGKQRLADMFDTDIVEDFNLVKALGLPTYDAYLIPCVEFIKKFAWFRKNFIHTHYYLNLLPTETGFRKLSLVGFGDLDEARRFIGSHLDGRHDKYMLRISEFEDNVYGGSIMSESDIVLAELSQGLQQKVAYGAVPVVGLTLTSYRKTAKYSTDDPFERTLLWRAIEAIMIRGQAGARLPACASLVHECGRYWFVKGYFEFAYTRCTDGAPLRLVFFDVKLGPAYYNVEAIG